MIGEINISKVKYIIIELKNKIILSLFFLIIFRIGSFIPIPGINVNIILNNLFKKNESIINMFNLFSGGSLRRASIFSLGILPYISSSMFVQLIYLLFNYYDKNKSLYINKNKINEYTYIFTILISIIQSFITIKNLPKLFYIENIFTFNFNNKIIFLSILSLVTGTLFLIWLSNQITINGMGNGTSIIMFYGILSELPENTINIINQVKNRHLNYSLFIIIMIVIFVIINIITFIESSYKKIYINYLGKFNYYKKNFYLDYIYLPIKINISGVTPIMLSYSTLLIINTFINFIINIFKFNFIIKKNINIYQNKLFYNIIYIFTIFIFCKIYTSIIFNTKEISDDLKKNGAYIYGIRPGNQTYIYIKDIINKLTIICSIYISLIYLIQDIIKNIIKYPININGTSILILVIVILDIITQIKSIIIPIKYNFILKKINIKKN